MVYLYKTGGSQVLFIPKTGMLQKHAMTLKLYNTMGGEIIMRDVMDIGTSELYYNLAVELPEDAPEGEYEYCLLDGELVLSTGIIVLRDEEYRESYETEITYKQYE